MEQAASASPWCSSTLGRDAGGTSKIRVPFSNMLRFPRGCDPALLNTMVKEAGGENSSGKPFSQARPSCFAATCKLPTPSSKLRRRRGRTHGRRWSWCARPPEERRPPPAPCRGCSGSEWRLRSPACCGGRGREEGVDKHLCPLPCLPSLVAETCSWRQSRQGLAWTSVAGTSERWGWRVGSSAEHLLPTPWTTMLPGACMQLGEGV